MTVGQYNILGVYVNVKTLELCNIFFMEANMQVGHL